MWVIFQKSGNSPIVMHLLKKLDNYIDTMQLAIFKNLDGVSLGGSWCGSHIVVVSVHNYLDQKSTICPKLVFQKRWRELKFGTKHVGWPIITGRFGSSRFRNRCNWSNF